MAERHSLPSTAIDETVTNTDQKGECSMPQIIVQAHTRDGAVELTLAERAVPTEQQDDHYLAQLIDRIGWALIVAERVESRNHGSHPDGPARAKAHVTNLGGAVTAGIAEHRLGRTRQLAEAKGSR
jgi:hypothetical protein